MLPDEKIMCHRTGFTVSCFDGVTKHKCRLWCHVSGFDANAGHAIDVFGCGDELDLKLLHEIAKEVRQAAASTDKVANETREMRDAATARDVFMMNGMKEGVLRLVENGDVNWQRQRWLDQAGDASGERVARLTHAAGAGGDELPDPGHDHVPAQDARGDRVAGEDPTADDVERVHLQADRGQADAVPQSGTNHE